MPVIAHNIASQFTNRQLNITTGKKTKSVEKLASGYKINRSADDAAGLSISEKMRSQIRGLNQASRNIQDGVSLCQVADGALNETTAVLQRMRELSIQSANGTNGESDRQAIQEEIDQLTKEVDRIAGTTSFNDNIYPLSGNTKIDNVDVIQNSDQITSVNYHYELPSDIYEITDSNPVCGEDGGVVIIDGVTYHKGEIFTMSGLYKEDPDYWCFQGNANILPTGAIWEVRVGRIDEYASLHISDLKIDNEGYVYYISAIDGSTKYLAEGVCYDPDKLNYFTLYSKNDYLDPTLKTKFVKGIKVEDGKNNVNNLMDNNVDSNIVYKLENIWIQSGSNTGEGLVLNLVDATAKGIGITDPNISVMSEEDCDDAMNRLDDAIQTVSSYRSQFGAYQNRLEHAKAVDDNTSENTQYAESRIRDTDMAKEMVEHSKNNILEQVGQSMLAQANQSTQGILSLLS